MCLHIIHLITHNSFLMLLLLHEEEQKFIVISLHIIKRSAQFKTVFSFSLFLFLRRFPWWKKKKNNVLRFFFFLLLLLVVYYSCCASCIASSRSSSSSSSSRQSEQHHHQSDEKERRRSKKRRCERRRRGERRSRRRVRPVSRPVRLVRVHGHEPGGGAMPATGGERHSRWERCDAERLPVRDTGEVFGRRESVYRGGKIRTKRVRDEEDIRGTRRI